MRRFVEGADRGQSTLLPDCLDNWIDENNPVRVIDAFVDAPDLAEFGFEGVEPLATGRPSYHPSVPDLRAQEPLHDKRCTADCRAAPCNWLAAPSFG